MVEFIENTGVIVFVQRIHSGVVFGDTLFDIALFDEAVFAFKSLLHKTFKIFAL